MLDSPYVRRVAIALLRLGLPFEHRPISLFRQIDEFAVVNPLLKAPTLVADDGTVLMDSTLIIDYARRSRRRRPACRRARPKRGSAPPGCSACRSRFAKRRCSFITSAPCGRRRGSTNPGRPACVASYTPALTRWRAKSMAARAGCSRIA
jgi:hypothetical protein